MTGILLSTYVESISTRKDKTVKVILSTQELSQERAGELFGLLNKLAVAYISVKDIGEDEIEKVDKANPDIPDGKTQSQRIRNVLYRLWEQAPEGYKDFNSFYHFKTEQIVEHFKSKLP